MFNNKRMKKIYVITGIYGHLGRALTIALSKEEDVLIRGLALPSEKIPEELNNINHELVRGDVRNKESLRPLFKKEEDQELYFIHTAGLISIFKRMTDTFYDVNYNGAKNTLDLAIEYKVKRYIYISSVDAFKVKKNDVVEEVSQYDENLKGAYAKIKAKVGNLIINNYADKLDVCIVHPSAIIGPYDKGHNLVIKLSANYLKNGHVNGATGGFDFVDVRDVAKAIVTITKKEKVARSYIISNHFYTIEELLLLVRKIASIKRKPIIFPLWLAKIFAPMIEFFAWHLHKSPLFTPYALRTISLHTTYLHDLAKNDLAYAPRPIEETIKSMVDYLLDTNK